MLGVLDASESQNVVFYDSEYRMVILTIQLSTKIDAASSPDIPSVASSQVVLEAYDSSV